MQLPQLPADKLQHAAYGAVVFLAVASFFSLIGFGNEGLLGLAAAGLAGVAKEAADWWSNKRTIAAGFQPIHGVEPLDAVATAAGGLVCFLAGLLS